MLFKYVLSRFNKGKIDKKAFGCWLRKRRKDMKITQEKLAECCDLSSRCIGNLERGQNAPSFTTLVAICHTVIMSYNHFLELLTMISDSETGEICADFDEKSQIEDTSYKSKGMKNNAKQDLEAEHNVEPLYQKTDFQNQLYYPNCFNLEVDEFGKDREKCPNCTSFIILKIVQY